jgi:poly-gamma-glutamate synthesis protein (capsule biosynthesis protein)
MGETETVRASGPPVSSLRRASAFLLAPVLLLVLSGCTPEQFQRWWVDRGNQPMAEPRLSEAAAGATRFWEEVARRNRFSVTVSPIGSTLAARMTPSSWRPGCPVPLEELRYLRVSYMDPAGSEMVGELVVHHDAAAVVAAVFEEMWDERFPITSMRLVDDFGGDDGASMAADNTSAFNCRSVTGGGRFSEHAYGRALDVNPVENPYVSGGVVQPAAGVQYLDRGNIRPGMLVGGSVVVAGFERRGWAWGGRWSSPVDHQHLSASGR